ncbi:hypothetical protein [Piscinibacter sakaiensis]|uniref:hypothetical protein n=1 Tax=Piscinibacter sakaiensis TaxID=1547922 RepID=UPI003AAD8F05
MSAMMSSPETESVDDRDDSASNALYLHLCVTDPETVAALLESAEGRDRQDLALTALKIGIMSLKAARGTVDGAAIRHEGDRLLGTLEERLLRHRELLDEVLGGTLRNYFDPASGSFTDRIQRLLRQDGELAAVIATQVDSARRTLDEMLTSHLGDDSALQSLLSPEEGNEFIAALRGQMTQALTLQSEAIAGEFSLDKADSALSRLVRELKDRHGDLERKLGEWVTSVVAEFSLDNKDSALSRLVGRVEQAQGQISAQFSLDNPESGLTRIVERLERFEQAQTERSQAFEVKMTSLLERIVTRRDDARRSTLYGNEFEQRVGEQLQTHCLAADEVLEPVGDSAGVVPRCKVGDFVVTIGPDSVAAGARIVVEAKASGAYSLKGTLAEADLARRNRSASVCLFVHSAQTAPAGMPELHRWGLDIVVVWDAENPATDVRLKAAYLLAKALSVRASQHDEDEAASLAEMDGAIEAIRKQINGFEEIRTSARTIVGGGEKILNRARLMEEEIGKRLAGLTTQVGRLRAASGDAAG